MTARMPYLALLLFCAHVCLLESDAYRSAGSTTSSERGRKLASRAKKAPRAPVARGQYATSYTKQQSAHLVEAMNEIYNDWQQTVIAFIGKSKNLPYWILTAVSEDYGTLETYVRENYLHFRSRKQRQLLQMVKGCFTMMVNTLVQYSAGFNESSVPAPAPSGASDASEQEGKKQKKARDPKRRVRFADEEAQSLSSVTEMADLKAERRQNTQTGEEAGLARQNNATSLEKAWAIMEEQGVWLHYPKCAVEWFRSLSPEV
eukprot:TRINITY_DN1908_c0_g3_i1.p1 TRINITY_DN1908_c0_g3~~TRINITY_DN1908_c0_g3_i1.p1  ORF type:complete len:285 (-),score=49.38 TRINITY_DN1908_c0_g3_i1:190-969(-)